MLRLEMMTPGLCNRALKRFVSHATDTATCRRTTAEVAWCRRLRPGVQNYVTTWSERLCLGEVKRRVVDPIDHVREKNGRHGKSRLNDCRVAIACGAKRIYFRPI